MKKSIQKLLAMLMISALLCLQAGCENANEINSLVVVMGVGFDEDAQRPQDIELVAQVVLPNNINLGTTTSGGSEKSYCNVVSSGENTFEAVREFTHIVCNKLYIAHNQVFVISKTIAQRGIMQYMDFFVRAKETRPTTVIVIADQTAAQILDVEPKMNITPANNITELVRQQVNNSQSMEATVLDYLNAMHCETVAFLAPIVSVDHQKEQPLISVQGLAVFDEDTMVGQLNADETRGLLWVLGKVKTGSINVVVADQKVAVDIVSCKTEIQSQIQNGKIVMTVTIEQKGTLAHQSGAENLATDDYFKQIEIQAERAIEHEITIAFEKAKALGADIFGFGEIVHKYHYKEWQTMKENWDKNFSAIELNIQINSTVVGSGTLTNSAEGKD